MQVLFLGNNCFNFRFITVSENNGIARRQTVVSYEIKPFASTHMKRYAQIYSKAFFGRPWFDPWKEEDVLIHLEEIASCAKYYGLECVLGGKVVGFVIGSSTLFHYGRSFYIHDLAVDPMYQCNGIGRNLMEQIMADLREQGIAEVQIAMTDVGILPKFCEELGFKQVTEVVTMGQKL